VVDRLGEIEAGLSIELSEATFRNSATSRLQSEAREVQDLIARLTRVSQLEVIQAATSPPAPGFTSLTLLSGNGYGEAYRSLMTLRRGLIVDGDAVKLSVKEISALYEAWCFISVARQLNLRYSAWGEGSALSISDRGLRVNLTQGRASALRFSSPSCNVILTYNPTYPGLTGDQRPDVVIEMNYPGWPAMFIVLDAKYRVRADSAYVERFGLPGPPSDAINALHRYRDAILLSEMGKGLGRPMVVGAALYPLNCEASEAWPGSRLHEALDTIGIGSIPYLPSNTSHLADWLDSILKSPPNDLARRSPPSWPGQAALSVGN